MFKDEKLEKFCNDKWEIAKALSERDGHSPMEVHIAWRDMKFSPFPIDKLLESGVQPTAIMDMAFSVAVEQGACALIITANTMTLDNKKFDPEAEEVEQALRDHGKLCLIQVVEFLWGAAYSRMAEKTESAGQVFFQDRSGFTSQGCETQ